MRTRRNGAKLGGTPKILRHGKPQEQMDKTMKYPQTDWSKLGPIKSSLGYSVEEERELLLELDPGIRRIVQILRENNVETCESCEGGPGHPVLLPTVWFYGMWYEGYRAFSIALRYKMPVLNLSRTYRVLDGELLGPSWSMTFIFCLPHTLQDRSDTASGK